MYQEKDRLERRCPRLGGPVTFKYCRTGGDSGDLCFKVFDCWWEIFDVVEYVKKNYSEETVRRISEKRPREKVLNIIELIEKARKAKKE